MAIRPGLTETTLVAGSLVAGAFDRIDYADAFRGELRPDDRADVGAFAVRLFESRPAFATSLMRTRDAVMGLFGVKKVLDDLAPLTFEPGKKSGPMHVFARRDDEILLGLDDRHLDFRFSILLTDGEASRAAVLATVVRFHGWPGRSYFAPVKPFHKRIVRSMLERALAMPSAPSGSESRR